MAAISISLKSHVYDCIPCVMTRTVTFPSLTKMLTHSIRGFLSYILFPKKESPKRISHQRIKVYTVIDSFPPQRYLVLLSLVDNSLEFSLLVLTPPGGRQSHRPMEIVAAYLGKETRGSEMPLPALGRQTVAPAQLLSPSNYL